MDEVQKLMKYFPGSFITPAMEVVLDRKFHTSFSVKENMSREDVLCKIFEWCSRDCAKAEPYCSHKMNTLSRDSLCLRFSKYIGKVFDQSDFYWIYDRLGNAINHERTLKFIAEGMNVENLIKEKQNDKEEIY